MQVSDWDDLLGTAAAEVLETMFFTAAYPLAEPAESTAGPRVAAHLDFAGTPAGALTLSVSEPAVRVLAANFLAPDEDGPVPASQLGSVVFELANMICGALLSHVNSDALFCLSSPELLPDGAAPPPGRPTRSLTLGEEMEGDAEDGAIDLWLALEPHAG